MENKKYFLIKIISTIIVLGIIAGCVFVIFQSQASTGKVTIEIVGLENNILDTKELEFSINQTLIELLEDNYQIIIEKGMLIKIDDLHTLDTTKEFIKIYVNDQTSLSGITSITLKDGDKISFILTATYQYG